MAQYSSGETRVSESMSERWVNGQATCCHEPPCWYCASVMVGGSLAGGALPVGTDGSYFANAQLAPWSNASTFSGLPLALTGTCLHWLPSQCATAASNPLEFRASFTPDAQMLFGETIRSVKILIPGGAAILVHVSA